MRADIPRGKGFYIYRFSLFDGSASDLVKQAADLGAKWLAPRVVGWATIDSKTEPYMDEFVDACHRHGIRVGGWGYHVGLDRLNRLIAEKEADAAALAVHRWGLSFYVLNAEIEYKVGRPYLTWRSRTRKQLSNAMLKFWQRFRLLQPELCAGLTSYRYPRVHPEFVWDAALDPRYCDFSQPQVYAIGDIREQGAAIQLGECFKQYDELAGDMLPMVPLEAFYTQGNWRQSAAQSVAFAQKARELGLVGYGAYTFEHATPPQHNAFAQSWTPPQPTDTQPVPVTSFESLSDAKKWAIVEKALKLHNLVDANGNVIES